MPADRKTCSACKTSKPVDEFGAPDRRGYRRSHCRQCRSSSRKERRATDADYRARENEQCRRRRQTPEGRAKAAAYARRPEVRERLAQRRKRDDVRAKEAETARQWRAANVIPLRDKQLQSRYGITIDQYEAMATDQDQACAICRRQVNLCVDHDHTTGAVRGLLWAECNKGLGTFRDDPRLLLLAADYLISQCARQEESEVSDDHHCS